VQRDGRSLTGVLSQHAGNPRLLTIDGNHHCDGILRGR